MNHLVLYYRHGIFEDTIFKFGKERFPGIGKVFRSLFKFYKAYSMPHVFLHGFSNDRKRGIEWFFRLKRVADKAGILLEN